MFYYVNIPPALGFSFRTMLLKSTLAIGPMMVLLLRMGQLQEVMTSEEGPETYEEISPVFLPLIQAHDRENARRLEVVYRFAIAAGVRTWPKDVEKRAEKLCEAGYKGPWDDTEMSIYLQGLTKPEIARACMYLEINEEGDLVYIGDDEEKEEEPKQGVKPDIPRVIEAKPLGFGKAPPPAQTSAAGGNDRL